MNNYVIEAGISQAVFTLLYFLFLRNETHYASRRLFLTGSVLVGLIVPLLHLPLASSTFSAANGGVMPMYFLEAIMVSSGGYFMAPVAFLPISVFDLVYVFISSVFFLWFMVSLFHLYRMYRRSAPLLVQNVRVRVYPGLRQSFSFFGLIFIGDPHPSIIYHEQAHGKLGHSFDSVLVNLFRVICWWSPFVWLTINELKLVHEYQADAMVMKGDKARDYRRLLISASMVPFGMGLASSFHEGPLIKRLNAMKKQTKHIPKWKLVVLGMMVAIVTLFFSCSVEMEKEINNLTNESSLTWEYPVDVAESLSLLEAKYPDNKFTVVKVRTQTQEQRQEIAAN
ncbi:MAG: hypothetical protein OEY56_03485, partial [Cyclobacteriaceae bacterium]|nr:hypothetical protein [Cyclobacteriaceae bacterium]